MTQSHTQGNWSSRRLILLYVAVSEAILDIICLLVYYDANRVLVRRHALRRVRVNNRGSQSGSDCASQPLGAIMAILQLATASMDRPMARRLPLGRIIADDARYILPELPDDCIDLSFWSPPYYVGKSYERHLSFDDWCDLLRDVIHCHNRIIKRGGFMVVNIGDILCFADATIPKFQANNVRGKVCSVTREQVLAAKRSHPQAKRQELADLLGCSEQTIQRRLQHNNVRGGKHATGTKVLLTGCMVSEWAEEAGLYLYDQRIWRKDPCWANSRWHSNSYRAVDEFEHIYVFWRPGITEYDRNRLTASEWAEWGSRGVWNIRSVSRNDRHEAEFPEELATRVIRLFSPEDGVILDPFVGSGTTTAVAKRLNRRWLGVDIEEKSARMAEVRTNAS